MAVEQLKEQFGQTGVKGGKGEELLFKYLQKIYDVKDYREDMTVQMLGVDFAVSKPTWKRAFTLDAKTNLKRINNQYEFTLELSKRGKAGWFHTSKSDRIYHIDLDNKLSVYYDLGEMRQALAHYMITDHKTAFKVMKIGGDILLHISIDHPAVKHIIKFFYLK